MTYGDNTQVTELCGNTGTTNLPTATITAAVGYADSVVEMKTGKNDWTSADDEYGAVQMASNLIAASYCLRRFGGNSKDALEKAESLWEQAKEIIDMIKENSDDALIVVTQSHRTYPLNDDATPYRSMSGANNSTDDSDL